MKYIVKLFVIFILLCIIINCKEKTKESSSFILTRPGTNIPQGLYRETKTLTLSSSSKSASIYYTTDGSEPNERSSVYTTPLTLSKTTNIKAYAKKDKYKTSDKLSALYRIFKWFFPNDVNDYIKNTYVQETQAWSTAPEVVTSNDGTTLSAWTEEDSSDYYVPINVYYNNRWNLYYIEYSTSPSIALNRENGGGIISWTSYANGAHYEIATSQFLNGSWQTATIHSTDGTNAYSSTVDMNNNNEIALAWVELSGGKYYIKTKIYSNGSWSAATTISPENTSHLMYPQIKIDDNKNVIVIWTQLKSDKLHLYKSEYRNNSWSIPTIDNNISPENGGELTGVYKISMNKNGNAIVVWDQTFSKSSGNGNDNERVYMSSYKNGIWTHPSSINDYISLPDLDASSPDVAINENNDGLIVWWQRNDASTLSTYKIEIKNNVLSSAQRIIDPKLDLGFSIENSTYLIYFNTPKITINKKGNMVIAWFGHDGTIYDKNNIYLRLYKSEYIENKWYMPTNINTDRLSFPVKDVPAVNLSMDDEDNIVILWNQLDLSDKNRIYKSEFREQK